MPRGPPAPPIPTRPDSLADGEAVKVDRVVSPAGTFVLGGHVSTGSPLLAARQVEIRIEPTVLLCAVLDLAEITRPVVVVSNRLITGHEWQPQPR